MELQGYGSGHGAREQRLLRVGAVRAIGGTVLYGAFGAAHGDLEIPATETALRFVAAHPAWRAVHLVGIFAYPLWAGVLTALSGALTRGPAGAPARLGQASLIVGATMAAADLALDGVGLETLANTWASAPPPQQADPLRAGDLLIIALPFLPFLLYGLAVLRSREFPAWLAWGGVVASGGWLAAGIALFADAGLATFDHVIVLQVLAALWTLSLGLLTWRRAGQPATA